MIGIRRSRFVLSLRVLLLLILVFGLWLGWKVNRARAEARAVALVQKYNGHVDYDREFSNGQLVPKGRPWALQWLERRVGKAYFQHVTGVFYVDQPISDATLAPLTEFENLEELCFLSRMGRHSLPKVIPPGDTGRLTAEGLQHLERLTHLRSLIVNGRNSEGLDLKHLNIPRALETLELTQLALDDDRMPSFKLMPRIKEIDLSYNRISGNSLVGIRGAGGLEILKLRRNPLSLAGMTIIGSLPNLRRVDLAYTPLDDEAIAYLGPLKQITHLQLNRTFVTDDGLASIAGMTQLEELDLEDCMITKRGLKSLIGLTRLKRLNLGRTGVDDAGLAVLGELQSLEVLQLYATPITDLGLVHLKPLQNLREVSLSNTGVSTDGVRHLRRMLPKAAKIEFFQ